MKSDLQDDCPKCGASALWEDCDDCDGTGDLQDDHKEGGFYLCNHYYGEYAEYNDDDPECVTCHRNKGWFRCPTCGTYPSDINADLDWDDDDEVDPQALRALCKK